MRPFCRIFIINSNEILTNWYLKFKNIGNEFNSCHLTGYEILILQENDNGVYTILHDNHSPTCEQQIENVLLKPPIR
jgi:hypothetical protein